jgi:osmoprotectant transport system substrate-binding protein
VRLAPGTLASTLVFGSGPECPSEPYCLPGLESTYGLTFARFVVTDSGGQKTIDALKDGSIHVGVLFTTDPHVVVDDLVLLDDDKHLQRAENVTPIVDERLTATYGQVLAGTIDAVSVKLTTAKLTDLNKQVQIDGTSAAEAAARFLADNGLRAPNAAATPAGGPTIVVGSANFSESSTLAEVYAQALTNAGFPVERRFAIGNRSTYFPLIRAGEVGLLTEYLGSLLGYLDEHATPPSDSAAAHEALCRELSGSGLVALQAAPAENKNGIVVTAATASRFALVTVSDLGKAAF